MEQSAAPTAGPMFRLRQSPAIPVAILIAAGILFCDLLPCWPRTWLGVTILFLIIAGLARRRLMFATSAAAFAILLVGLTAAQIERFEFPANHIAAYTTSGDRFAEVELEIDQTPRLLMPSPGELRTLPPKQITEAAVRAIRAKAGWTPAGGRLELLLEDPNPRLAAGQIVRATGMLERPASPMNPGEFDAAAFDRDRRILASLRVSHSDGVQILEQHWPGALVWLREKTRHLLAQGFPANLALDHALLRALVLGDPDPQLRDVDDEFVRTGMIHQLSISGLHIAMIGGVVLLLCRLLRLSPRISIASALLFVALYAAVALPSWPGWRSVIMCAVASAGLLARRPVRGLQLLAIAVAIALLIHPADLWDGGFQVSFVAVLGLMLLSQRAQLGFWTWWRGPDAIAAPPKKHGPIRAFANRVGHFVLTSLVASAVAWAASMPLIAYRYGRLNLLSVPGNVLRLPLTFVALLGGVLKILLTLILPAASGLSATVASWPVALMRHVIHFMDSLPGAAISLSTPSITLLCIYFTLLAAGLFRFKRAGLRRLASLAPFAACVGFVLWTIPGKPTPTIFPRHELRITLLSLGAGQTAIVRPDSNHAIFFDAGSSTVSDLMRRLIAPYLQSVSCSRIDKIFLSHGDFDHISATADLFREYNQPQVFTSPQFAKHAVGNFVAESLLDSLQNARSPPKIIHRGDHLDFGDGVSADVLWPPANCDMNSNNCGLVIQLKFAGRKILFPADIQEPPEIELLKDPDQLRSDILVAPHHGSAESTTAAFVAAVHPRIILASNAQRLTHKQKTFDALAAGYPLYRTSLDGAISLTIEASGNIKLATFLPVSPQGISALPAGVVSANSFENKGD
jgi:competence protein ComEC